MSKLLAAVLLTVPLTFPGTGQTPLAAPSAGSIPAPAMGMEGAPVSVPKPAAYLGGKRDTEDTAAWRCGIARDIKSDKLAHSNGMPIDANDLQTAESDIRLFCR